MSKRVSVRRSSPLQNCSVLAAGSSGGVWKRLGAAMRRDGTTGDFSQQRAVLSFLGTSVCLGIPGVQPPAAFCKPGGVVCGLHLEYQLWGCVKSLWSPVLSRMGDVSSLSRESPTDIPVCIGGDRGPCWANMPSDRSEFLHLLQVSQSSQAACHWFGGSVGGTECNRLIYPGFCPKH